MALISAMYPVAEQVGAAASSKPWRFLIPAAIPIYQLSWMDNSVARSSRRH